MNLEDLTVTAAASAIREGQVSAADYAHALLSRIDNVESRVHAWFTIDREAVLSEARKCDAEAHVGQFRGPLHGVPVGIKDIFYTKDLRTTMGSPVFESFVPQHDARVVARLKQAGAIILGKCVTTMFANLDPSPTRNPWNLEHTPGGSSSGSAAAVAARMCPGSVGSQTLGSVGRPAAFNGVASLVPTQKRISLEHVFPLAWSLDHVGFFGRSVADLELMLGVTTESAVQTPAMRQPIRLGIVREFFYEKASSEARSVNDALADKLQNGGFHVEEIRLPEIFNAAQAALRVIVRSEAASNHSELFKEHRDTYGRKIRALVETGLLLDAKTYVHVQNDVVPLIEEDDGAADNHAPSAFRQSCQSGLECRRQWLNFLLQAGGQLAIPRQLFLQSRRKPFFFCKARRQSSHVGRLREPFANDTFVALSNRNAHCDARLSIALIPALRANFPCSCRQDQNHQ